MFFNNGVQNHLKDHCLFDKYGLSLCALVVVILRSRQRIAESIALRHSARSPSGRSRRQFCQEQPCG